MPVSELFTKRDSQPNDAEPEKSEDRKDDDTPDEYTMLAQRGDPSWPTYELWFSFTNENERWRFVNLVRDDGYADPDDADDGFSPPGSLKDLPDLLPFL